MLTSIINSCTLKCVYTAATPCIKILKRNLMKNHPYKNIHPWTSFTQFVDDLLNNIIYNKDGLVVLNKPYGITREHPNKIATTTTNLVPNGVHYTLSEALPEIAKQLNYQTLTIVKSPEKYMSGITLLAKNKHVSHEVEVAYARSQFQASTYWIVTVGIPKELQGQNRLAIKRISDDRFLHNKMVLLSEWSHNEEKFHKIKLLKTEHKVLSKSTLNLCSLIELKSSTQHKNAIRLFASTYLYSPVLGDTIYASRIQKIGGTYARVDPFLSQPGPLNLDMNILQLLDVTSNEREIIPAHIHLKSIVLPSFFGSTARFEAPLMPYFDWTCKQLDLKY